jgi:hypothetical protein
MDSDNFNTDYQRLTPVSIVMLNGRNGGKGDCEQYFEGVTIVSHVMCSNWNGWKKKVNVKVKRSHYKLGQAYRVSGSCGARL